HPPRNRRAATIPTGVDGRPTTGRQRCLHPDDYPAPARVLAAPLRPDRQEHPCSCGNTHPHGHGASLMEYLLLKWIHIVSSTFLFGTGVGRAFYNLTADLGGDKHHIAHTNRTVVLADWLFTTPTAIIQPVSGVMLAHMLGYPLTSPWLLASILLY